MIFFCSSRLQYLCSHFNTLSTEGDGMLYSLHRIGTNMLVGKSHWAMMASIEPSNACSLLRASFSKSSKEKLGDSTAVLTDSRLCTLNCSEWRKVSSSSRCCSSNATTKIFRFIYLSLIAPLGKRYSIEQVLPRFLSSFSSLKIRSRRLRFHGQDDSLPFVIAVKQTALDMISSNT